MRMLESDTFRDALAIFAIMTYFAVVFGWIAFTEIGIAGVVAVVFSVVFVGATVGLYAVWHLRDLRALGAEKS